MALELDEQAYAELIARISQDLGGYFAPATIVDQVRKLRSWQVQVASDASMGRLLTGPQWIDGISITDGTVIAEKINVPDLEAIQTNTGNLLVTGNIRAVSDPLVGYPGVIIESSGNLRIKNSSGADIVKFESSGSTIATIGSGATAITVSASGTVSIPAGAIAGGLTIANISSGVFGGTYTTAPTGARLVLSTQGISLLDNVGGTDREMFALKFENVAGTLRSQFRLEGGPTTQQRVLLTQEGLYLMPANQTATSNALVAIESTGFRIRSAITGSRVEITPTAISGYQQVNATTTIETFRIDNTGRFTIQSATSGNRIVLTTASSNPQNNGLFLYGVQNNIERIIMSARLDGTITLGYDAPISIDPAGTISINPAAVKSGTIGGTWSIGSANEIVTSNGKITFGNDYITDNLIAFRVGSTESAMINITSSSASLYSSASLSGSVGNNTCRIALSATPRVDATQQPYNSAALELYNVGNTTYIQQYVTGPGTVGMVEVAKQAGNHPQVTISGHTTIGAPSNPSNLTVNGAVSVTSNITASGAISATGAISGASVTATGAITGKFQWGSAYRGNWPSGNYTLTRYIQIYDETGAAWGICPVYTN